MAQPIVVTISHSLGAEEAQRRIAEGLEHGGARSGSFFQSFETKWTANHADVVAVALRQRIVCGLDVFADLVRVEVQLPWYLSALQDKIAGALQSEGEKMLRIGRS